jgi:hypothetical protein
MPEDGRLDLTRSFKGLITQCAPQYRTKHSASKQIFENQQFPITSAQQRQQVDAAGRRAFSDGLIRVFVFDILQIPSSAHHPPPSPHYMRVFLPTLSLL